MAMLSQPAFGPKLSIGLIIVGALMDVWALVWRFTLAPEPLTPTARFWYFGFLLTGFTFLLVGFFLGQIGRAARNAELPPPEATAAEAAIQQTGAANPPPVAPAMPGAIPNGVVANQLPTTPAAAPVANARPVVINGR
jgi:hypothetical protein